MVADTSSRATLWLDGYMSFRAVMTDRIANARVEPTHAHAMRMLLSSHEVQRITGHFTSIGPCRRRRIIRRVYFVMLAGSPINCWCPIATTTISTHTKHRSTGSNRKQQK